MKEIKGSLQDSGKRFAIVVARFNELVTESLLKGALKALEQHGNTLKTPIVWVPGCFEIPLVAKKLALSGKFDAIICLGAVIRGSTPHFEYVSSQTAAGISSVALETGIPTLFGVLTTDTTDQAFERAGIKGGNKGYDAACAAIEMANLIPLLPI